eukprot:sb/3474422/
MSYMSRVSDDLLAKEEEYHRLNAEIEEKTRQLVEEVTNISMEKEATLSPRASVDQSPSTSLLDTVTSPVFRTEYPDEPAGAADGEVEVLPVEAQDLGTSATIRLLKAKVRVLEEEVERMTIENSHSNCQQTKERCGQ